MKKTILEEALADAKELKAMAIAQAKLTLAESLTPAIEAALSSQLKKDLLEGEYEEEEEGVKNESVMEAISKLGLDETTLAAISKALGETKGDDAEEAPAKPTKPAEEDDEQDDEEGEQADEAFDLDAALAEIEGSQEDESVKDEDAVNEEAEVEDDQEQENEALDIDAILAEMDDDSADDEEEKDAVNEEAEEGEDGDGTETQDQPNEEDLDEAALFEKFKAFVKGEKVASSAPIKKVPEKELEDPKGSLKEGVIVAELRGELKDLNVLAAKLLYQNKTLIENSLTESQKAKVIVAFDKVKTVDEAKLIFETLTAKNKTTKTTKRKPLGESFGLISLNKKTITESAQPSGTEYSEEQKLMMKRAGIKF